MLSEIVHLNYRSGGLSIIGSGVLLKQVERVDLLIAAPQWVGILLVEALFSSPLILIIYPLDSFEELGVSHYEGGLLEVADQDGQEKIHQNDIANDDEQDEVYASIPACGQHAVEHHLTPIVAYDGLEHGHYGPGEGVEILTRDCSIDLIKFPSIIKVKFPSEKLHAQQGKNVHKEHHDSRIAHHH